MNKGQSGSTILLIVIMLTVLVLGIIFVNQSKKLTNDQSNITPTEAILESDLLKDTILEEPIEEGLYLELINPPDGSNFNTPNITVSGNTEANAEVFINEKELKADLEGNFSTNLLLEEGDNIIVVTASDDEGNYAEKSLTVTYEVTETF